MTERQLITEFILQKIIKNDFVEVEHAREGIIRGYVIADDVFSKDYNHSLNQIRMVVHKDDRFKPKSKIILRLPNGNSDSIRLVDGGDAIAMRFPSIPKTKTVYPEDILSIIKIEVY